MADSISSSISTYSSHSPLQPSTNSGLAGMLNQIQQLQRQCADWEGCSTTAAGDKQKIISGLSQQIQTLQSRVDRVQTTTSLNTLDSTRSDQYALQNELRNAQSIKSSLTDNRPVAGAISGSIINLSV